MSEFNENDQKSQDQIWSKTDATRAFLEALVREAKKRGRDAKSAFVNYYLKRANVAGAPEPKDLQPVHARTVLEFGFFDPIRHKDFDDFHQEIQAKIQAEFELMNPYVSKEFEKAEGQKNQWSNDTGKLSSKAKNEIAEAQRETTPALSQGKLKPFQQGPIADNQLMIQIVESLVKVLALIIRPLGEDSETTWRWGASLCLVAGLGLDAVRMFARQNRYDDDWTTWLKASDEELVEQILESHELTGYGLGTLRLDYGDVIFALSGEKKLKRAPRWLKALTATHIFKYVRYIPNFNGQPHLWACYRGKFGMVPIPEAGLNVSFTDGANKSLRASIGALLGLASGKDALGVATCSSLSHIHPSMLAQPLDLPSRYIAPPHVSLSMVCETKSSRGWIATGVEAKPYATIDVKTGAVDLGGSVAGADVLKYKLPLGELSAVSYKKWASVLPAKVLSMRPSSVFKALIRNVDTLGFPEGFDAVLDTIVMLDLVREQLVGSDLGNTALNEFVLFWFLPWESLPELVTNIGKTYGARMIAGCVAPGIQVSKVSCSPSAPAQRSAATPIEDFGTALYDEFTVPQSHDHFLNAAGLQNLATGGVAMPGRALENSKGVSLKHFLTMTAKVGPSVMDLRTRSFFVFMKTLAESNRCSQQQLDVILSGRAAMAMRLCALRLIDEMGYVERLRALSVTQGAWRFNAHLTAATLFADIAQINGYMTEALLKCDEQRKGADASGLSDEVGAQPGFDPEYYLREAKDEIVDEMARRCADGRPCTQKDFLLRIVDNNEMDRHKAEFRANHVREKGALAILNTAAREGRLSRPGWKFTYVGEAESTSKDKYGHPYPYIKVERIGC